jgi:hypothetical protein
MFAGIRRTTWPVLALTIAAYACANLFVAAVLFQGRISESLGSLYVATGFLVQGSLVGGLFCLAIVSFILFAVGRLRGSDVGWGAPEVGLGLLVTLGFWIAMNGVLAVLAALSGGVFWDEAWKQRGPSAVVGGVVGQLLGNSLVEETLFRGFLLPQFYLIAATVNRRGAALAIAVVASSLLFAVSHVPHRLLVQGLTGSELLWDQAGIFLLGLFIATAYVVTRNLFVAVGLHALVNEPVPVIRASSETTLYVVWAGLAVQLLLAWRAASVARNRTRRLPRVK